MKLETFTVTDSAGKQQKVTFIDSEKDGDSLFERNSGTIQIVGIVATLAVSFITAVVLIKNNFKKVV